MSSNFIVSARKYRPATFISVVGQSHITSTLKNAITRGQLAHGYLFCGPRGVGKTTLARIFAKAINCLSPRDGEACNECESCMAFDSGRSFNIHELDAASNNSVDDIRNLTEQVRIPPQMGRYSVYIIDEVHMLSLQAFNAFLKTLEEPPAHAVFILATTEKHKIIPTILSRCQIYDFNRIRVEDSVAYLKYIAEQEGVTTDEESLHIISQKADGGMRDALSMFDKVVSFCGNTLDAARVAETLNVLDYDTYFKLTDLLLAGDYAQTLVLFDGILRKGFGGQIFLNGLNGHFRNLLMCKSPQTLSLLEVTGSVAQRYTEQSGQWQIPMLFESVNLLTTLDSTFRTATNQRLHVELGLMKLCGMGQKKNVVDSNDANQTSAGNYITPVLPTPRAVEPVVEAQSQPIQSTQPTSVVQSPPQPAVQPVSVAAQPVTNAVTTQSTPPQTTPQRGSVTGFSLKDMMNGAAEGATKDNAEEQNRQSDIAAANNIPIEEIEKSIIKACRKLSIELVDDRPRLATALQSVTVSGNVVTFRVSNDILCEEIERTSIELKKQLTELGNVRSAIEFSIIVEEDTSFIKPVRVEDKWVYLTELNANLSDFRKSLELEIE